MGKPKEKFQKYKKLDYQEQAFFSISQIRIPETKKVKKQPLRRIKAEDSIDSPVVKEISPSNNVKIVHQASKSRRKEGEIDTAAQIAYEQSSKPQTARAIRRQGGEPFNVRHLHEELNDELRANGSLNTNSATSQPKFFAYATTKGENLGEIDKNKVALQIQHNMSEQQPDLSLSCDPWGGQHLNHRLVLGSQFKHEEASATITHDQLTGRRDSQEQLGTELASEKADGPPKNVQPAQVRTDEVVRSHVVSRGASFKPRAQVAIASTSSHPSFRIITAESSNELSARNIIAQVERMMLVGQGQNQSPPKQPNIRDLKLYEIPVDKKAKLAAMSKKKLAPMQRLKTALDDTPEEAPFLVVFNSLPRQSIPFDCQINDDLPVTNRQHAVKGSHVKMPSKPQHIKVLQQLNLTETSSDLNQIPAQNVETVMSKRGTQVRVMNPFEPETKETVNT